MALELDVVGIQRALVDLFKTGPSEGWDSKWESNQQTRVVTIFFEATDRDKIFDNYPYIDVRLLEIENEPITIPGGEYATITFEIDIVAFSFLSPEEAATVRSNLLKQLRRIVHDNKRFHGDVNTAHLAPDLDFNQGSSDEGALPAFIASVTLDVTVEVFLD